MSYLRLHQRMQAMKVNTRAYVGMWCRVSSHFNINFLLINASFYAQFSKIFFQTVIIIFKNISTWKDKMWVYLWEIGDINVL